MALRILFMLLLLLSSCGRPLTEQERGFASAVQGTTLDLDSVRLVKGAPVVPVTYFREARPREACRERILPPVRVWCGYRKTGRRRPVQQGLFRARLVS